MTVAKHIHIHVHTRDAFSEGNVKRDQGGKFSTTGSAGGNRAHHLAQNAAHGQASRIARGNVDPAVAMKTNEVYHHHVKAANNHIMAEMHLAEAHKTHKTDPAKHKEHMAKAQEFANAAAEHVAELKKRGVELGNPKAPAAAPATSAPNPGQKLLDLAAKQAAESMKTPNPRNEG